MHTFFALVTCEAIFVQRTVVIKPMRELRTLANKKKGAFP